MNRGKAKAQILGLRPRGSNPILLLEHGVISGRRFRVAGLFAGVGGLELGLGRAGHETMMLCEIDPPARAVLETRFPSLPLEDDVRKVEKIPSNVDLLVGGFPCQDLSQAGKTAGIEGANSGLVGEVCRLLETRPVPWVLLENVPFMLRLAKGRALDVIVSRFERLGYRWAYRVVDTRAFGLPQRRERVFIFWPRSKATQEEYCSPTTQESRHPPPGIRGPWYWASIGPRESAGSGPESTACRLSRVAPQSASHPLPPSSFLAVAW